MPRNLRAPSSTKSPELVLVLDDRIILCDIKGMNDHKRKHAHPPPGRAQSVTRQHRRCETRKDRPV